MFVVIAKIMGNFRHETSQQGPTWITEFIFQIWVRLMRLFCFFWMCQSDNKIKSPYILNKKSLNGQGKSMVTVLEKKFLGWLRNFHSFAATIFFWVNQEICVSSFQQGKYCGSRFRGYFPWKVNQIVKSFQGAIFRPNRPVFNSMILYQLDTLRLTQEKEKSSVA